MDEFSSLLERYRRPIERYVRFRLASACDADDVLQDIFLTAYRRFDSLRDRQAFLAWLMANRTVRMYGIRGATILYTILMAGLAVIFAGVMFLFIKKRVHFNQ